MPFFSLCSCSSTSQLPNFKSNFKKYLAVPKHARLLLLMTGSRWALFLVISFRALKSMQNCWLLALLTKIVGNPCGILQYSTIPVTSISFIALSTNFLWWRGVVLPFLYGVMIPLYQFSFLLSILPKSLSSQINKSIFFLSNIITFSLNSKGTLAFLNSSPLSWCAVLSALVILLILAA